jgi:hypothetical protein
VLRNILSAVVYQPLMRKLAAQQSDHISNLKLSFWSLDTRLFKPSKG